MRQSFKLFAALALVLLISAPALAGDTGPIEVVQSAYVDGIQRNADADAMRAGFDPAFVMFVNSDDGVTTITRDDWAARIEKAGADPDRKAPKIDADLEIVGHNGTAAVVKVELSRDGKHVFTDFLSLYETTDGWKIVGKIYQRHP
jgi:ketosteroid isomerase-like protein